MLAAIRMTLALLKLRIGVAIAASALAGMVATSGQPLSLSQTAALLLAVLGASGAAGAFNHYYERDSDRLMRRTQSRPFASGAFRASAWWLAGFFALLVGSLTLAAAAGGAMSALYVFLGAFTYGILYTVWLKSRSVWNIVVGGLAGSFAVLAGAAAVDPSPQAAPMLLALVLFLWTPPHFWSLAAAKSADYAQAGVPMLPVVAQERVWTLAILAHTAGVFVVSLVPLALGSGILYGLGAATGGFVFLLKSWELYRRPSRQTAIGNFLASLLQLLLLVAGVVLERLFGSLL